MELRARTRKVAVALAAVLWAAGCTLENATAPDVVGPSEFGLSVTISAVPDRLPRDGSSQSVVTLLVRDAQNQPTSGQRLTLSVSPPAARLSVSEVTTDANGRATFTVTAPAAADLAGDVVTILATPVGNTSGGSVPRTIEVRLTGAANTTVPNPSFTVTPPSPEVAQVATFDASASTDEGAPCLGGCAYSWNFGDGSTAAGRIVNHAFSRAGAYTVTLTVTDSAGASASAFLSIRVVAVAAPVVTLTNVPDPALVNQRTVFNAAVTPAPGHSIQRYEWNFGDGTTDVTTSPTVAHTYTAVDTYVATVTVTDDLGQTAIGAKTVVVGFREAAPVASFTVSPTTPSPGATVTLDGSSSSVGSPATIVRYVWRPGDGSTIDSGTSPTTTTRYLVPGTYTVTLTITDSLGRQDTETGTVTVAIP